MVIPSINKHCRRCLREWVNCIIPCHMQMQYMQFSCSPLSRHRRQILWIHFFLAFRKGISHTRSLVGKNANFQFFRFRHFTSIQRMQFVSLRAQTVWQFSSLAIYIFRCCCGSARCEDTRHCFAFVGVCMQIVCVNCAATAMLSLSRDCLSRQYHNNKWSWIWSNHSSQLV